MSTTTYVSAVIMRNAHGEERDVLAQAIEDLSPRIEEVYLPVEPSGVASAGDALRHAAYQLILQAEELDDRAADVAPPTHDVTDELEEHGGEAFQTYVVGDPDPTPSRLKPSPGWCFSTRRGFVCTWPAGHAHPQHVAGNGTSVVSVWPAR